MKNLLLKIIMVFTLASILTSAVYASNNGSIAEQLEEFEDIMGIAPQGTISDRLEYFEIQVFGSAQEGSYVERLESLENTVLGKGDKSSDSGWSNADSFDGSYDDYKSETSLKDLSCFDRDEGILMSSLYNKDSYDNSYQMDICSEGVVFSGTDKDSITFYTGMEYSTLKGTLYITRLGTEDFEEYDYAMFIIYGEDEAGKEQVLYKKDDFSNRMKPFEISVDISSAEYIRLEFVHAWHNTGLARHDSLFAFGDPVVY